METTEGGRPKAALALWWRPKAATFVLALNTAHVLAFNTAQVLRLNMADAMARSRAHALRFNSKICPVFTANTKETTKGGRPKAIFFVLAVTTGHILVLRRKTCALLRGKTSALLRRKTCAVLRARTCALFRTNTKLTFFEIADGLFCAQESQNS